MKFLTLSTSIIHALEQIPFFFFAHSLAGDICHMAVRVSWKVHGRLGGSSPAYLRRVCSGAGRAKIMSLCHTLSQREREEPAKGCPRKLVYYVAINTWKWLGKNESKAKKPKNISTSVLEDYFFFSAVIHEDISGPEARKRLHSLYSGRLLLDVYLLPELYWKIGGVIDHLSFSRHRCYQGVC